MTVQSRQLFEALPPATELLYDVTGETDGGNGSSLVPWESPPLTATIHEERAWLARLDDPIVAKSRAAMWEAARNCAQKAGRLLSEQNAYAEKALLNNRKAGELLAAVEKNRGGWPSCDNTVLSQDEPPTYAELGFSGMQAHRAQKLPAVPEPFVEQFVERVKKNVALVESGLEADRVDPLEVTTNGLLRAYHLEVFKSSEQDEWLTPKDILKRSSRYSGPSTSTRAATAMGRRMCRPNGTTGRQTTGCIGRGGGASL